MVTGRLIHTVMVPIVVTGGLIHTITVPIVVTGGLIPHYDVANNGHW